ncbi:uncharacterized protein LOC121876519 [Homarus americanus]|uniref:uncharacterized protein LOC121876519 n=1 Tax=Homarus americanus TaxID=6706 RepID=UPI001C44CD33|nr:uncharacterized protein LOC121876519 [Homarus americanus]
MHCTNENYIHLSYCFRTNTDSQIPEVKKCTKCSYFVTVLSTLPPTPSSSSYSIQPIFLSTLYYMRGRMSRMITRTECPSNWIVCLIRLHKRTSDRVNEQPATSTYPLLASMMINVSKSHCSYFHLVLL